MKRRRFFATGVLVGGVGLTGCLSDDGSTESNGELPGGQERTTDDQTEDCRLAHRREQGKADPIEASAAVNEGNGESTDCGFEAAEKAIEYLDDQLLVELGGASWIQPAYSHTDDQATVWVRATGSDGEMTSCADPKWDFDDAVAVLPTEITLSLTDENGAKYDECSHEVVLEQGTMWEE